MDLSKRDRPNILAGIGSSGARGPGLGAHWYWVVILGLVAGVVVVATAMHSMTALGSCARAKLANVESRPPEAGPECRGGSSDHARL
jgi:hypothetical protein